MENLIAARLQMAISLGFHIVFAALGIGLPLLMLIAEGLWLRTHRRVYLDLAKKWAKAAGVLFAIGAVSGTALSFELGLLWPYIIYPDLTLDAAAAPRPTLDFLVVSAIPGLMLLIPSLLFLFAVFKGRNPQAEKSTGDLP